MANQYILVKNKKIPIKYRQAKPSWTWMKSGWLGDISQITPEIIEYATKLDEEIGQLDELAGQKFLNQYIIESYTKELKSSWQIEGENLDSLKLRSSLIRHLALDLPEWYYPKINVRSERENNAVKAALNLINNQKPLSLELILHAHFLLKDDNLDTQTTDFGKFRTKSEIVGSLSPDLNYYEIIYEASPADNLPDLLQQYLEWWHKSYQILPLSIGAALAHLYFVEIHPFHDGNGRMARLLFDTYLANKAQNTFRPYSMQAILHTHRFDNQDTLSKKSALTGASLPKNFTVNEDGNNVIINNIEQLTPYLCVSHEILSKQNIYYIHLENYSNSCNLTDYLIYMLALQQSAVKGALKRISLLRDLAIFFEKYSSKFNEDERSILKNSYLADAEYVSFLDATSEISDNYLAHTAWHKLKKAGLISLTGKAILDDSLVKNLEK